MVFLLGICLFKIIINTSKIYRICLCPGMSVAQDLTNRLTDMVLLYREASCRYYYGKNYSGEWHIYPPKGNHPWKK